ncbi:MAG: restriction endonuclease [Candidatus Brocadiales bacterium]|nr:restriction endonuclease [Candidatus Brocadiales bacterium]
MESNLSFELREAIVSVIGKIFWLKDPFRAFLISCNVPSEMYARYSDESKYKIARHVLSDLDTMGEDGYLVQRRIVTELCKLRKIPDDNVADKEAGIEALRWLKKLAFEQQLVVENDQSAAEARAHEARQKQIALAARARKMEQLKADFIAMTMAKNSEEVQRRGYDLEELLAQLFEAHEISYRRPYRVGNEQIDGHFRYKGFDYLVEAKWRSKLPTESELAALKRKVDKKLTSTRGLFLSMAGFRTEVVFEFIRGESSNIILMDGADLILILEGHVSLIDALELKIRKAAQEGIIFFPLAQRFEQ